MLAGRIGEVIGAFAFLFAIAYAVLFVNRHRKNNPTPYIAAGVMTAALVGFTFVSNADSPVGVAGYITWLSLIAFYEKHSNKSPTGLSRIRWIAHALLLLLVFSMLGDNYGIHTANGAAFLGMGCIVAALLWKWVRLVPMTSK